MLRTETVEAGTLALITSLCSDENLKAFNLVGGTALALKIGHRKSIDIDLFSTAPFDPHKLCDYLIHQYKATPLKVKGPGVFGFIGEVKIDLVHYRYPLIGEIESLEGVRLVSLIDIAAMKLDAICNSGSRLKDFIDIYYLLEHFSINQMIKAFGEKYNHSHAPIVLRALQHHQDIDFTLPVDFIGEKKEWYIIADRLRKACRMPYLTFNRVNAAKSIKRLLKIEHNRKRGKRR